MKCPDCGTALLRDDEPCPSCLPSLAERSPPSKYTEESRKAAPMSELETGFPAYYCDARRRWPWLPEKTEALDDEWRNATVAENALLLGRLADAAIEAARYQAACPEALRCEKCGCDYEPRCPGCAPPEADVRLAERAERIAELEERLAAMMPLFEEARDALPAILLSSAKLRGIRLDLADRMDAVGDPKRWAERESAKEPGDER